jgi:hypothetical protein
MFVGRIPFAELCRFVVEVCTQAEVIVFSVILGC